MACRVHCRARNSKGLLLEEGGVVVAHSCESNGAPAHFSAVATLCDQGEFLMPRTAELNAAEALLCKMGIAVSVCVDDYLICNVHFEGSVD